MVGVADRQGKSNADGEDEIHTASFKDIAEDDTYIYGMSYIVCSR